MHSRQDLTLGLGDSGSASFRRLAESIPGALLSFGLQADGRLSLQALSSRCQQLWELEPALVEQDTALLWQMVDAAEQPALCASVQQSAQALTPWQAEWPITTPSGQRKWLQGSGQPERMADGAVIWMAVILDISERKLAQLALLNSETRFRALVEGLEKVSVQGYDRERRVIVWNAASEALYGFSKAEALGQRLEDLIIPPAMREAVIAGTRAWLEAGAVSIPAEELILQRKDGTPVHVFSSHTMQINGQGEAELYCVDIDLSERERLEEQLREAQKLEAMGRLAGGIAHDFNNVLGALLGNVALARAHLPALHPARPPLDLIERGGQHARQLVQQILAFSRRQPQQLAKLALRPLLEGTLALLQAGTTPGVKLELDLADEPLLVLADTTQLQQVLINLYTNACYALGGRPGRVQLGLAALSPAAAASVAASETSLGAGGWAHLWVRDDGCGMDAATLAHLFEPFFTTKPVGVGTGLGLAVVHGIVLAHRGLIRVESEVGSGTCFHVYLPLLASAAVPLPDAALRPLALAQAQAGAESVRGRHVLYLDDDEVMRLTAQGLLQRLGYRVSLFQRGGAALAALAADPAAFDLVVTDFNMPDLSGLQVAQEVAAIRPDLPVVMSSGYVSEHLLQEARRVGVRAVLRKEMSVEELGPVLQSLLT